MAGMAGGHDMEEKMLLSSFSMLQEISSAAEMHLMCRLWVQDLI